MSSVFSPLISKRVNSFSTAVPLGGHSSQIPRSLSPKRDCGPKRTNRPFGCVSIAGSVECSQVQPRMPVLIPDEM